MILDADPDAIGVAAQPFRLRWPDPDSTDGGWRHHTLGAVR
jgi:hypothetical protein